MTSALAVLQAPLVYRTAGAMLSRLLQQSAGAAGGQPAQPSASHAAICGKYLRLEA